jgi:FkbM family methyltransferase
MEGITVMENVQSLGSGKAAEGDIVLSILRKGALLGPRACLCFQRPVTVFRRWLHRDWRPDDPIILRNGWQIGCSRDPNDIMTVKEVFIERCYGRIPCGGVVVDIGANIGVFSVYAAQWAKRVLAFEPSVESMEVLQRNIRTNGLDGRIEARMVAVSNRDGDILQFAVVSNRENRPITGALSAEANTVPTTTLAAIVREVSVIDLLKLDCEGSEREIILSTPADVWRNVRSIRMEYHDGLNEVLVPHLIAQGFRLTQHRPGSTGFGMLWFNQC